MAQVGDFVKHYFYGGKQMQYRRGVGWVRERHFLDWRGGWTVGGWGVVSVCWHSAVNELGCVSKCWLFAVSVRKQVLAFCSVCASVWRHLSPARKIDSISIGYPF